MRTLRGVGIGRGAVYGPVARVNPAPAVPIEEKPLPDRRGARQHMLDVFDAVSEALRARAASTIGPTAAKVEAAAQMAADPALHAEILGGIDAGEAPALAVDRVINGFCELYLSLGGTAAERVSELRAVRDRVVAMLIGEPVPGVPLLSQKSIIVASELDPAETSALDLDLVLAIVTEQGGPTSHTSIVASQLGIPCVVRVDGAADLEDGQLVAVDAATGTVTVDPDLEVRRQHDERAGALAALSQDHSPGATKDGRRIELLANVGTVAGALRALSAGVEGIGLLRTEVLYLERTEAPSVEEQAAMYSAVMRMFPQGRVAVRTVDSGPDRMFAAPGQSTIRNPALGLRGLRIARTRRDLLADQLEALARAQKRTGLAASVMAPMVATAAEAAEFAVMAHSYGLEHVGVMVEVPSAAIRAEQILAEVDYAALGTNDLAQYTMAADRLCGELADLLDLWEPAVLELVARTARAGHSLDKPVGVCGESASDPLMALVLVGMGASSLSMSPTALPTAKYALRHHTLAQCEEMAAQVAAAATGAEARRAVVRLLDDEVRSLLAIPPS